MPIIMFYLMGVFFAVVFAFSKHVSKTGSVTLHDFIANVFKGMCSWAYLVGVLLTFIIEKGDKIIIYKKPVVDAPKINRIKKP